MHVLAVYLLRISISICWVLQAAPFYRIFAADARAPRDGKHVDVVGHFDPIPGITAGKERFDFCLDRHESRYFYWRSAGKDGNKHITLNIERIK